ncbi:hypothetical protein TRIUR3_04413 [Triticum urartu]|uniref:Uncharacterized protein n=1 Tax=Triticum urartu TaxID=4572 RepID=M7Z608_TRIUA|nr:hypothetical protein TRIUR3_04413 [Triticum urartu]
MAWLRDYGDLGLLDADEGPDDSDAFFPPPRHNDVEALATEMEAVDGEELAAK